MNKFASKPRFCQRTIRVRGIVQGVGFRPTVLRYANELGLCGRVWNDCEGVMIECSGTEQDVDLLIQRLQQEPPPQAIVRGIEHWPSDSAVSLDIDGFEIAPSVNLAAVNTGISPDLATCPACLTETLQAGNRRYRYPFTNCTHCGPRLSIVAALPYDRANTSMKNFAQCSACQAEYQNQDDRRFHAQPNACPECGPTVRLVDSCGQAVESNDPLKTAQQYLREGMILAIKGIGGFQLAVDATNTATVAELRRRKQRPHKPFALMVSGISVIDDYCEVSEQEQHLLESAAAPVVLLKRRDCHKAFLPGVAPEQSRLGFMLPNTPLHHLLLENFDRPLVMTSGNVNGAPQCIDNSNALQSLSEVVDLFVLHDRDILNRVDDSVVQVVDGQQQLLRRGRGFAPAPLPVPQGFEESPDILALGGDLKNTFCLISGGQAILSQHIGDLKDAMTFADFQHTLALFQHMHQQQPRVIAVDQHPQYLSANLGREMAQENDLQLVEVQHHHAHITACLADNQRPLSAPPVLAVTLDGMGYANTANGAQIWGGEIFIADYRDAKRLACLKPVSLPGGNAAMQQPWRNCLAQLQAAVGWQQVVDDYACLPLVKRLSRQPVSTLLRMIDQGINSPLSSSCGRLFDAVAAAVGICDEGGMSYEGQAAMLLASSIDEADWHSAKPYPFALNRVDGLLHIDPSPLWLALLKDLKKGRSRSLIASSFHRGLVEVLVTCLIELATQQGTQTVALSGGVFQNPYMLGDLQMRLQKQGFKVLVHTHVPANDGGIALGQALIAAAKMNNDIRGESACV